MIDLYSVGFNECPDTLNSKPTKIPTGPPIPLCAGSGIGLTSINFDEVPSNFSKIYFLLNLLLYAIKYHKWH